MTEEFANQFPSISIVLYFGVLHMNYYICFSCNQTVKFVKYENR